MFNYFTGKEFEHTFEEIMEEWKKIRFIPVDERCDSVMTLYRRIWDYYSEARDVIEIEEFDRPDGRTKLGKRAHELRAACELEIGRDYARRYRWMCRADIRLSNKNK